MDKASPVGHEISCVMHGISDKILRDNEGLRKILLEGLRKDRFSILDVSSHEFSPQGFSLGVLLGESHANIHTYPEYGSLTFQLYGCRGERDGRKTYKYLVKKLNPKKVDLVERAVRVG